MTVSLLDPRYGSPTSGVEANGGAGRRVFHVDRHYLSMGAALFAVYLTSSDFDQVSELFLQENPELNDHV
jgi:hypothetical protein